MVEPKKLEPDKLYTPREAAEIIGVNPETVRRWVREGRVPAQKGLVGQAFKIRGADLAREVERLHWGSEAE
jgi:excisionase family DNA binding protein